MNIWLISWGKPSLRRVADQSLTYTLVILKLLYLPKERGFNIKEYQCLRHMKTCKYHAVLIPKWQKQAIFGALRKHSFRRDLSGIGVTKKVQGCWMVLDGWHMFMCVQSGAGRRTLQPNEIWTIDVLGGLCVTRVFEYPNSKPPVLPEAINLPILILIE